MTLKGIMRPSAKKEFSRLLRRFKIHECYISVNGVYTAARKAYMAKQARKGILDEDDDDDDGDDDEGAPVPLMAMAARAAVEAVK
jgi:hypothetical protein